MATHSSVLAWRIPETGEPGGLLSMGSLGVGHNWVTSLPLFTFMHWRRKWQPTPVFLPGESQGREAWWAAVYGVAQSRIQLKRLSSSVRKNSRKKKIPPRMSSMWLVIKKKYYILEKVMSLHSRSIFSIRENAFKKQIAHKIVKNLVTLSCDKACAKISSKSC